MPGVKGSTEYEIVSGSRPEQDPIVWWLWFSIFFLIVVAVVFVLYAVMSGFFSSSPRTLIESRLQTLSTAIKASPQSGDARRDYIMALTAAGQYQQAQQVFQQGIKDLKGFEGTKVYYAGVNLAFTQGDYKGTLKLAQEALAADEQARKKEIARVNAEGIKLNDLGFDNDARISILLLQARAFGSLSDWKSTLAPLTAALALDPQATDILTYRADAYRHLGDTAKATADYKKALLFIPDYAPALNGLKEIGQSK